MLYAHCSSDLKRDLYLILTSLSSVFPASEENRLGAQTSEGA